MKNESLLLPIKYTALMKEAESISETSFYIPFSCSSGFTTWSEINAFTLPFCLKRKVKLYFFAVPLHAMEALGGRGDITLTHSRPRH
jgi:hypothetical protein